MSKPNIVVLKLRDEEYRQLTEAAARLGMTRQQVIRLMLRVYLPRLMQGLELTQGHGQ